MEMKDCKFQSEKETFWALLGILQGEAKTSNFTKETNVYSDKNAFQ